MQECKYTILG